VDSSEQGTTQAGNERIIDRIRKLFALSGSTNEAEALSASEKAHELLKQYNLSVEDLNEKPEVGEAVVGQAGRNTQWKSSLLDDVATFNYCSLVLSRNWEGIKYRVFGREANIKSTVATYEYLVGAINRIAREYQEYRNFNTNRFKLGASIRIGERLRELMIRETTECTALVVVSTEAEQARAKACPNLTKSKYAWPEIDHSLMLGHSAGGRIGLNDQIEEKNGQDRMAVEA